MSFVESLHARDKEREYARGHGRRAGTAWFNPGYVLFGMGVALLACALLGGAPVPAAARPAYDCNALPTLEIQPCK